jgi:outer membrane protein OmpA-like peptidoglycan-associated protein
MKVINRYIPFIILLVSVQFIQGQNKATQAADKLFDRLEYVLAAKSYTALADAGKADAYVYKQLGDCYFYIFNTQAASTWYAKAVESEQDGETHFRYAQMLKAQGNYTAAMAQMAIFAKKQPNDARAKAYKSNPNYVPQVKEQPTLYTIKKSDLSSDKADFGAVLTANNQVYFASNRNTTGKTYGMDKEPFLDIYKATLNQDGSLSNATGVDGINTKWHDGPVSITADGNTMYYASESFNQNKQYQHDKSKHLKYGQIYLYKATLQDGKWQNSQMLPINDKNFSMRNPSISKDGKTLYFSSDMPGGMGGEDVWMVTVDGDTYGTAVNLGSQVNTEGNESFPFIHEDGTLFFASNGKQGLGGYDIFAYDFQKKTTTNVGQPVNTAQDDFALTYNKTKDLGFISSNRDGNDDIYQVQAICGVEAIVEVTDQVTGVAIDNANVSMLNSNGKTTGQNTTNSQGQTGFAIACKENHSIQVNKDGYESATANVSAQQGGQARVQVQLTPIKPVITEREVILQPIYFEYDKANITAQGAAELDKLVAVMNEYPNMVISARSHTDSRGNDKYNLRLSDRRAKATAQYIISKGIAKERISGQGAGETEPKETCTDNCTEEQHAKNRRSEFLIVRK